MEGFESVIEEYLTVPTLLCVLTAGIIGYLIYGSAEKSGRGKVVPLVRGGYPLIGHGLHLQKDWFGFLQTCVRRYGGIFQIKLFFWNVFFVCDRELTGDFIKSDNLSNTAFFESMNVPEIFYEDKRLFANTLGLIRKAAASLKQDSALPRIQRHAQEAISRLRSSSNSPETLVDLNQEMIRFVFHSTASSFLGLELSADSEVMKSFHSLAHYLDIYMQTAPLKLGPVVSWLFKGRISKAREILLELILPHVRETGNNAEAESEDSPLVSLAKAHVKADTGKGLTEKEIGSVLIHSLWLSTGQTNVALTNLLIDLASSPIWLGQVRRECQDLLDKGDLKGIVASRLIHACVMESARLNSNYGVNVRYPLHKSARIGDYSVGKADMIFVSNTLVMDNTEEEPLVFNPDRFLNRKTPIQLLNWGKGVHSCSGKLLALYQIKVFLALFLTTYELDLSKSHLVRSEFVSSGFQEHKVKAYLNLIRPSSTF